MAKENVNPNLPPNLTLTQSSRKHKSTYHLHVDVDPNYQPLQKRNRAKHLSYQQMDQSRLQGEHHLDLWTDGRLYPKNPQTNAPPPFCNVTSLLHFTGDGKQGLLGYIQNIESKASSLEKVIEVLSCRNKELHRHNQQSIELLRSYEENVQYLTKKINTMRQKDTELGTRKRKRKLSNLHQLKLGSGGVKKRIHAVRLSSLNKTLLYLF